MSSDNESCPMHGSISGTALPSASVLIRWASRHTKSANIWALLKWESHRNDSPTPLLETDNRLSEICVTVLTKNKGLCSEDSLHKRISEEESTGFK